MLDHRSRIKINAFILVEDYSKERKEKKKSKEKNKSGTLSKHRGRA